MCLLAILSRVAEDAPLILAANREEEYARGGTPPQLIEDKVRFVAGTDPRAGGTWFGVSEHGLVAAVTNGHKNGSREAVRSRGLLVKDLLGCRTAAEAARHAALEVTTGKYAPCNLLCADLDMVYVVRSAAWVQVLPLPAGIHVLTKGGLTSTADPRVRRALTWLEGKQMPTSRMWLELARRMCADAEDEDGGAICVSGSRGGTVSSTLLALRRPVRSSTLLHAQGPPSVTPYADMSFLLRFE